MVVEGRLGEAWAELRRLSASAPMEEDWREARPVERPA